MPKGQIEHANLSVTDPERSLRLLKELFGWKERWRGHSQLGGDTIHVGDETTYIALYTNEEIAQQTEGAGYQKGSPLNHIGVLVDNLDGAEKVVIDHGLATFSHGDYEPGRRFYFKDWDGIEFEVVSYDDDLQGGPS